MLKSIGFKRKGVKMYKYYVAFAHKNGFGYCEISKNNKINSCDDVIDMAKEISKKWRWKRSDCIKLYLASQP
jgi:hypothetical protein